MNFSIAMVKFKNVAQRYILQQLPDGIDFLMHNAGLRCIPPSFCLKYGCKVLES